MRKIEKNLRDRLKAALEENQKLRRDRELFRDHFVQRFKWWLQLMGENATPNMRDLIESDAKWLVKFERWWW